MQGQLSQLTAINSNMGCHTVCVTAASIVQPLVRPYAPSAKLASRRSVFYSNCSSQLLTVRPAARAPICRARIVMGLPIPIIGPLFNPFFAIVAYALGAARFWSNYDKTSFDGTQKTKLTALWPILAIGSKNFRDELKKTLN